MKKILEYTLVALMLLISVESYSAGPIVGYGASWGYSSSNGDNKLTPRYENGEYSYVNRSDLANINHIVIKKCEENPTCVRVITHLDHPEMYSDTLFACKSYADSAKGYISSYPWNSYEQFEYQFDFSKSSSVYSLPVRERFSKVLQELATALRIDQNWVKDILAADLLSLL